MTRIQGVRVAVVGASLSGKTDLASTLNDEHYRRHADHRSFQCFATEWNGPIPDIWDKFQFILVTFDLSGSAGLYKEARDLALEILKFASPYQQGLVAVVGTKSDLIPQDYSENDLYVRGYQSRCACLDKLKFFGVSSRTGSGIVDVCRFIENQIYPCPHFKTSQSIKLFLSHAGTWFLDAIATIFSLPAPKNGLHESPNTLELDDAAVEALTETPDAITWANTLLPYSVFGGVSTYKITPNLIAKSRSHSEYENMVYIRKHTTIPVPQPRYPHMSTYLVMDHIEGKMLLECWESQTLFMKFRIACTLRSYIAQLRRLTGTVPGTIVDGVVSGPLFDDQDHGPFDSPLSFKHWCEMVAYSGWCTLASQFVAGDWDDVPVLPIIDDSDWSLAFIHGDLNLGNIILSQDGSLWIIDWATSGFFPPWLEGVGIAMYWNAPSSWKRFHWLITGQKPRHKLFWDIFFPDVHRFPVSRRL